MWGGGINRSYWFALAPLAACLVLASGQAVADTNVTIDTTTTLTPVTGTNIVRIGDPCSSCNVPYKGKTNVTITSNGYVTINNYGFQITAYGPTNNYAENTSITSSPEDPEVLAIAGSSVVVDGGKLNQTGSTKWLEVGRTNEGHLTVQNGGTVNTQGAVGIGAWPS
ncbi:hypothetical protein [Gallibacterium sp. AGMB14963]|uniref:hypothetical protein n=1 Tax=Gallibacterium faecale TaxID=3019086 RepID=UPI0022F17B6F|nr:hypothetical protein [Gallibacterium sp. AGMB14963]MDA3977880.1 hypothetical protein [Gallibacterium sp. AGMB14963]